MRCGNCDKADGRGCVKEARHKGAHTIRQNAEAVYLDQLTATVEECLDCGEALGEGDPCETCSRIRIARNQPDERTRRALERGTRTIGEDFAAFSARR